MRLRKLHDLAMLKRSFIDALASVRADDEAETFELAASASRFSRQTKEVVDDKLSFSATLMRAGEVDAANRLLAEVENEVLNEEVALIEQVNEVAIARVMRREKVTRMRLARSLAVAFLGAALMSFSALGMAVASMIAERSQPPPVADNDFRIPRRHTSQSADATEQSPLSKVKRVRIAGQLVAMSSSELEAYKQLTTGAVDSAELTDFLFSVFPASVAQKVQDAIAATEEVQEAGEQTEAAVEAKVVRVKKKADQEAAKKQEPQTEEPTEDPTAGTEEEQQDEEGDSSGGGSDKKKSDDEEDDEEGDGSSLPITTGDE
jgi:hypothetical protein